MENLKCEKMAWKYVLLGIGVFFAAVAYWLYTPLPDAYSSACARQIQTANAFARIIGAVVGVFAIFVTYVSSVNPGDLRGPSPPPPLPPPLIKNTGMRVSSQPLKVSASFLASSVPIMCLQLELHARHHWGAYSIPRAPS